MTRMLFTFSVLSLTLIAAALVLGLSVGDLYDNPSQQTRDLASVHRLTGIAAALGVVFVESLVITYFIGTSRWCREVVETYGFDPALSAVSQRLKRRTFPWALLGMLCVVGMGALGAAADPSTFRPGTADWAIIHQLAGYAGLAFIAWTYYAAWNNVHANQQAIGRIVEEVARVRAERGLA